MQLSEHFELAEFLVSETAARRGIANEPSPEVIENLRRLCQLVLQPLRIKLGRPVIITSGYRSPALNRAVGGSKTSHHMQGRAADLIVPGLSPLAVCQTAQQMKLPCVQIIHELQPRTAEMEIPGKSLAGGMVAAAAGERRPGGPHRA